MIEQHKITPKSVVEIGCGGGEILNQLFRMMPGDIIFSGYDISGDAIKLAKQREKPNLIFKHEDFWTTKENFDLLLMIDVFEHVDNYLGFIKACRNRAKYSIFHIPLDITVLGILQSKLMYTRKSVGHLHYFKKDTAIATLSDCGYEIVDFFFTAGAIELPQRTLKSKLATLPRKLFYKINKNLAVKTIGDYSLLVLAK